MTCIVAVEHNGKIWMGADSASSDDEGCGILTRADEKIFINHQVIMGFCGSFRVGQLMRYSFQVPEQSSNIEDMSFMVNDFIDEIRDLQKEKGSSFKENEFEFHESSIIVGYKGSIYIIGEDYQVARPHDKFAAIGSGADVALGSLYTTKNLDMSPEQRLKLALQASAEYISNVRGPFVFLHI